MPKAESEGRSQRAQAEIMGESAVRRMRSTNKGTSPHVALDTSADADAVQLDIYRHLGGPGRAAIAFRLNASVRALTAAGIRRRHPTYDETQVRLAATRLSIGDDLMRRAFPGHELVDP